MSTFRADDHNPEGCEGCRPVVFDPKTGEMNLAASIAAEKVFASVSPETRKAWHRVTCLNSRDPIDLTLAKTIVAGLQRAMAH